MPQKRLKKKQKDKKALNETGIQEAYGFVQLDICRLLPIGQANGENVSFQSEH